MILYFLYFFLLNILDCSKLKGVIDIFRHGARSSNTVDKTGKDIINQFWEHGKAELTSTGIRQHYLAGSQMRIKYYHQTNFLSNDYNELSMYSTNTNRTILSGYARLIGLLNSTNNIIPIKMIELPVKSRNFDEQCFTEEKGKLNNETKAKIEKYMKKFENTIYPKLKNKLYLLIEKKLSKGRNLSYVPSSKLKKFEPKMMYHITEAIYCSQIEKKNLSYLELSSMNFTFFEEFRHFFLFNGKRDRNETISYISPYVKLILSKIDNFFIKGNKLKYIGLAVHDSTLVNFIKIFEMANIISKEMYQFPFASQLLIEVYENLDLRFIYNDKILFNINFNSFKLKLEKIFRDKIEEHKGCRYFFESSLGNSFTNLIYFLILIDMFLFIFLLILIFLCKEKIKDSKISSKETKDHRNQEINLISANASKSSNFFLNDLN